jgi:hypothetical protein
LIVKVDVKVDGWLLEEGREKTARKEYNHRLGLLRVEEKLCPSVHRFMNEPWLCARA